MFLKITQSNGYQYVRIVRSYWKDGKSRQQVVVNLGRLDLLKQQGQLKQLGKQLLALDGTDVPTLDELEELERLCYGDIVYKQLWDKYQFTAILAGVIKDKKIQFDFLQTAYLLVIDRLLHPRSKLACFKRQGKYIIIDDVQLHHLYRSLDLLAEAKTALETTIFDRQKDLFHRSVDVVFYDVTTFHFESDRADDLKEFGFSKAGKFNEVQVVMGLLIDMEGNPIGYDLFPGNTFEGNTLLEALAVLKQRFSIRKLIFVADKAINSNKNLHLIQAAGYDYIVSARLKNSATKIKDEIFGSQGYHCLTTDQSGNTTFKYKVLTNHKVSYRDEQGSTQQWIDNLIITWSAERAHRDGQDRERQINKAQQLIDQHHPVAAKKGYQRYIATEGAHKVVGLDEERIAEDALWDGYYGIQASATNLDATAVIEAYHQLWKIEESFRVLKATMRVRPIFHWTAKRIKGHFVACFMALLLERALEHKLKANNIAASPETIKEAIQSLEVSEIQLRGERYYLKAKQLPLASKILNVLRIKHLRNISSKEEIAAQFN
jgi:transposase